MEETVIKNNSANEQEKLATLSLQDDQELSESEYDVENVKEKTDAELISMMTSIQETYSGPLPHPSILKGYEDVLPGSADRILQMAENEADHRHKMDNKIITSRSRDSFLGVIFGFIISAIGVGGGVYLVATGTAGVGAAITAMSLSSLVGVFIYGTRESQKQSQNKDE